MGGWQRALAHGGTGERRAVLGALVERMVPERVSHGKYRLRVGWSADGEHLRRLAEAVTDVRVA